MNLGLEYSSGVNLKQQIPVPCVIAFHFTISMYMLRTFRPMFHCICMYVDVMVCVCQT